MRRYKISTLANAKFADYGLVRAPQHLDDLAVGASIPFDARDANHHAIAMHGGLRRFTRDVNVAFQAFDGMIGNQESVAVAMHVQAAHSVFAAEPGDYKMTGTNFHQLPALDQAIQRVLQLVARCELRA